MIEKAGEPMGASVVDGLPLATRFRDILDALFAFVGFFSVDGVVLDANQAPLASSGLLRGEVIGHRFVDLPWFAHSADERARVAAAIARAARGQASRFETSVDSPRNGLVAIDAAFAPLRGEDGAIKYVVGTGVDVTVRRQAENGLRRSRERLAEAQRLAHLGSWEWDVVQDRVSWSDELCQIFGVDPRHYLPSYESFLASEHPDDRAHTANALRLARQNCSPFVYDHRIVRSDGGVRMLHTRGEVVTGTDGRALRLLGSCLDVTERWEATRTAEAARAEAETAAAELRALATRLSEVREEERRDISRELHDQVGQALTALRLDLDGIRARMGGLAPAEVAARLGAMDTLVEQTLETTRRISTALRPAILDDLGLPAAVRWQAAEFSQRTGIPCETRLPSDEIALGPAPALALFRILQEALTNVARHANASRVRIELTVDAEADVVLEIVDEGQGFVSGQIPARRSLGLVGMRERALALGGEVEISGMPGRGTTVRARIPAAAPESA